VKVVRVTTAGGRQAWHPAGGDAFQRHTPAGSVRRRRRRTVPAAPADPRLSP